MTTKKEIYEMGKTRGRNLASWTDLPEIGSRPNQMIAYETCISEIEDIHDAHDIFVALTWQAEQMNRDYSPFEFIAHDLNKMVETKPYDPWEVFEEGIRVGIKKEWKERKGHYKEMTAKIKKETS